MNVIFPIKLYTMKALAEICTSILVPLSQMLKSLSSPISTQIVAKSFIFCSLSTLCLSVPQSRLLALSDFCRSVIFYDDFALERSNMRLPLIQLF